jgi:hypothetical protein
LAGGAALIFGTQGVSRLIFATALVGLAVVLKLYPLFCVATSIRLNRRALSFSIAIAALTVVYLILISKYIFLIRLNAPTTFILSYGYKVPFLGLDFLRSETGLSPIGLTDTWLPTSLAMLTLILAAATAILVFRCAGLPCSIADSAAGTSVFFGAGIYCGTFLLGSNFIYRLMFLLLCLPQLQDWISGAPPCGRLTAIVARQLVMFIMAALWLNGSANGHSTFTLVPQLIDWLIFFALAAVLLTNSLQSARPARNRPVTVVPPT